MTVIRTKVGVTPEILLAHARNHFPKELHGAFKRSANKTTRVAKNKAPYYHSSKYPTWAGMPNAHRVGGALKRSITRGVIKQTLNTLSTTIYSRKSYSGYMESGFLHTRVKYGKWIRGKYFIKSALDTVHRIDFPKQITIAFKKAFMDM